MNEPELRILPYYQPIISMSTKSVDGYEILARGVRNDGTIVPPKDLFHGIDESCAIEIDRGLRAEALKQAASVSTDIRLFFNFSPDYFLNVKDVRKDSYILAMCEKYGADPRNIVIEITESAISDVPALISILKSYADMGFVLAIDDWGAEYSNFDRLIKLKPAIVKFDAAFLWRAAADPMICEILLLAAQTVSKLGIQIIAEGVETIEHLYLALEAGFPMAQGFYLGMPEPGFHAPGNLAEKLETAFSSYRIGKISHIVKTREKIDTFMRILNNGIVTRLRENPPRDEIIGYMKQLMDKNPGVHKSFLLNPEGVQVSPNLVRNGCGVLEDDSMLYRDWSWRPYFLESIAREKLYKTLHNVTGPYVDPEIGKSVYTVCISLGHHTLCIDYINDEYDFSDH